MGIKWENIKVLCSALGNEIYLGKTVTDKSNDRAREIIAAVACYMDKEAGKHIDKFIIDCPAGRLIWERKSGIRGISHDHIM